jgi:DNA-binding CsgD family transcriptional regulator/PAS domain-containing protein
VNIQVEQDQERDLGFDVAQFDELISSLYEVAVNPGVLGQTLNLVRSIFKANYVTLIMRASDEPSLSPMFVSGDIDNMGETGTLYYFDYHENSTLFCNLPMDKVYIREDLMDDAEWSNSAHYLMYCHPYNVFYTMGANIQTTEGVTLRFRISRPRSAGRFTEVDRERCRILVPHLRRTMHLYSRLDRSESLGTLYSQAIARLSVATMMLDAQGKVLEMNPVAREILASNDGLKLVGGRLEATYPSDNRDLQALLRLAFTRRDAAFSGGEVLSISRPSGQVNLGVVVESVPSQDLTESKGRPAAIVYIRDALGKSRASNLVAKQLFNLTPAETALAMELANGLSLEEAAEVLNIRRNTARAHLRSIFSKTGVRRQTELVRIMLNSVVALGSTI